MGCKLINSYSHPKFPTKTLTIPFTSSSIQSKLRTHSISFSSNNQNQNQQQLPIITTTTTTQSDQEVSQQNLYNIEFKTLRDCKLGISIFPDFVYNADGGKGIGTGIKINSNSLPNDVSVCFDLQKLYIPPLTSVTTRFLGLPLPPFLKIDIVPELLQGTIDEETGKVDLEFKAKFWFSVGSLYRAPPLFVETVLTSEESRGSMRRGKGERLNKEGKCRLVGVATLDPIDDIFMNTFLGLPTECLADLNATIYIGS